MKRVSLILALLLLVSMALAQLAIDYVFDVSADTYTPITGGTELGNASSDAQVYVDPLYPLGANLATGPGFPIGFNFDFMGITYDRVAVCTDGWISLGQSSLTPSVNIPPTYFTINATSNISPAHLVSRISALGSNLSGQTNSSIRIATVGVYPNRELVVQWENYRKRLATGDNYNFQIRLQENGNKVLIVYGTMLNNSSNNNAQVGIRGEPANQAINFKNLMSTTSWTNPSQGTANNSTMRLNATIYPPSGTTYTWALPVIDSPPLPTTLISPLDGQQPVSLTPTLSWERIYGAEGYKLSLWRGSPAQYVVDEIDLGYTFSYQVNEPLEPDTQYYWQAIPFNGFGNAQNCPVWSFTTSEAGLVPIGMGSQNLSLPINPYWRYSYTQSIYLQPEINTANQRIEKISYHWNGAGSGANSKEWDIYMGHTSQTNYANASSWILPSNMVQVFSGTVPLTDEAGWMEITLHRPFLYNNADNLVIAVNEVAMGENSSSEYFYCTATPGIKRSNKYYVQGSPIIPADPPGGIGTEGIANILIRFNAIPEIPELAFDLYKVDFGVVPQNRWTGPVDLKITNVGGRTLYLTAEDLYLSGADASSFQFSTVNLPAALETDQSVIIPIYVNPHQEGAIQANLVARFGGNTHISKLMASGNPIGSTIIGTGTLESYYPFNTDFLVWEARMQTLFTAEELFRNGAVAGNLDRIGWNAFEYGMGTMENFSINIKSVPYTTTSISTFSQGGFNNCYFNEGLELFDTGWVYFDLDTPFVWNGIDNIIVETQFHNEMDFGYEAYPVYATAIPGKTVVYALSDMDMMDEDGEPLSARPNTFFRFTPSSDSAVFNIVPNVSNWNFGQMLVDNEYTKTFRVSNSGASNLVFNSVNVSGTYFSPATPFDTSPIAPSAYRDFVVKFHPTITGGPYNGSLVFSFNRETVTLNLSGSAYNATTLPFCEDWESGTSTWILVNENQTNKWHQGQADPHQENYSVFISSDGGTTNSYNTSSSSISHIYRDFTFDEDCLEFPLTFWWKNVGESGHDMLNVYLVDVSVMPEAGVELDPAYKMNSAEYSISFNWAQANIALPRYASGTTKRLVFSWINDSNTGSQPPANLDEICLDIVPLPSDPVAPPILVYPANGQQNMPRFGFAYQFRWNTAGMEPDTYSLYVAKVDDLPENYDQDDFFAGAELYDDITSPYLPDAVFYDYNGRYVWTVHAQHIATGDQAYQWPPYEFRIEPDLSISTFPWTVDFENVPSEGFPPAGWKVYDLDGDGTAWGAIGNYNHTPGGNVSVVHTWGQTPDDEEDGWMITPPIVLGDDDWMLNFWNMNVYPQDYTYNGVWVTTGNPDPNVGPWTELWHPTVAVDAWNQEAIDLSDYAGQTIHIAFVYQGTYAHGWLIDDINIRSITTDNIPPTISHLPMLGTPRVGFSHHVIAEIMDDSFWNSPIGGANLYYSINEGYTWSQAIPMEQASGNTYEGYLPGFELGTRVSYKIEAWDSFINLSTTEIFSFMVDDPVWIFYDYGQDYQGYMPSGIAPYTWGAVNLFQNPYYGTGTPLILYATEAATMNPQTNAHLNVYLWNGTENESKLARSYFATPISVNFGGAQTVGWDYFEFADYNDGEPLIITDRYFSIAFENLSDTGIQSTNSYFVFDTSYDYGTYGLTVSFNPGNWYTFTDVGGSWSISALVGAGAVEQIPAPQISIAQTDDMLTLQWEEIEGAGSYNIYATSDPAQQRPWPLFAPEIQSSSYSFSASENYQFFYVTTSDISRHITGVPIIDPVNILSNKIRVNALKTGLDSGLPKIPFPKMNLLPGTRK